MSKEGYESSSSSEGEEEFGLSPYVFEPERTPAEVENLLKELELKQNSPQDDFPPRNRRIGNIGWCLCSKTCDAMITETESLCCKEGGVVVIATAQLHSTKPELRFWAGSDPARGVSEIRDGEDL